MATLNPEMSISGTTATGDISDLLSEVKPDASADKDKKININTDEIEEKDVAIQMLAVFIDELGAVFAPYVEDASKILLALIDYEANDSIRNSVAGALPGLIKCVKNADPSAGPQIINMGRIFLQKLFETIKKETETDCLICQVQAAKEIIDEIGENSGLLNQDAVQGLAQLLIEQYTKSDERIAENNELAKNQTQTEDEDEQFDEDDLEVIKEENNNEYDFQLSIAEIMGTLFKTHGSLCGDLINQLINVTLPAALNSNEKQKTKFGLFVMDDMVEFLGPALLGPLYVQIAQQIIKFCSSPTAAVR
jgi:hypothetical protein